MAILTQSRQDIDRVARILDVLAKYQFGEFADRVRIGEKIRIRIPRYIPTKQILYKTPPERLRLMLEELGTTFVKFGQLMSTREDIVGAEYAEELSKLQDRMKPFSSEEARAVVEEEFRKPVTEIFASFDKEPFASASMAQVHKAKLKNGRRVVVKIQRPGIEETVKEDIRILHYLAHMANKYIPEIRKFDPVYLVNEFERAILKELDFIREARNAVHLKVNFKGDKGVYIPEVYEDLCTKRVIVMEEAKGARLSEIISTHSDKFDRKLIAHRCAQTFFKMVMEDGFYHADMHPGNILVMDRNVICLLDFGRVGTIDREVSDNFFRISFFAINGDINGLIAHLLRTGMLSESADIDMLRSDIADVLDEYYDRQTKNIKIGQMMSDLVSVMGRYDFNRPRETAELTSALFILEGMCTRLNPKFNITEEFEPYAKKVLTNTSFNSEKFGDTISSNLLDVQYMVRDLPATIRRFFKKLDEGKMKIELAHRDLDTFTEDLDRLTDKVSMALIFAALIVGSSLIVQVNALLGLFVFVLSAIAGVWFVLRTALG